MSDSQILTAAIAIMVPVSTLLAGVFLQDHRLVALRAELTDAVKDIRTDIREIRGEVREIRGELGAIREHIAAIGQRITILDARVERLENRPSH